MIMTTKEIVDKWYDYQFRKTRGLSRQWLSVDEVKKLRERIKDDYDSYVGRDTDYINGIRKGYAEVIQMINEFFPSPDSPALKFDVVDVVCNVCGGRHKSRNKRRGVK